MHIDGLIAILALPLLLPLGLLLLAKGVLGLRDGRLEFYWLSYEGLQARVAGGVAVVLSLILLAFCRILLARGLGLWQIG